MHEAKIKSKSESSFYRGRWCISVLGLLTFQLRYDKKFYVLISTLLESHWLKKKNYENGLVVISG
jgi:hypothetical protein